MSEISDFPPPLSADQVALIEISFTRALRGKAELADRVYERFFQLEPATRVLFAMDLTQQRAKITRALSLTVRAMASDEELWKTAENLARTHARFQLTLAQLSHMADAILGALGDCLQGSFTQGMHDSWQAAFDRFLPMIITAQNRLEAAQ